MCTSTNSRPNLATGTIQCTGTGGCGSYSFQFRRVLNSDDRAVSEVQGSGAYRLGAGTYLVVMTDDGSGCQVRTTVVVRELMRKSLVTATSGLTGPAARCADTAGVDFGECDAVLGYGVSSGTCTEVSGCDSGLYELFSSVDVCQDYCERTNTRDGTAPHRTNWQLTRCLCSLQGCRGTQLWSTERRLPMRELRRGLLPRRWTLQESVAAAPPRCSKMSAECTVCGRGAGVLRPCGAVSDTECQCTEDCLESSDNNNGVTPSGDDPNLACTLEESGGEENEAWCLRKLPPAGTPWQEF